MVAFGVTALATMDAGALQLTGIKSRKIHAAAGTFDLTIDTSQAFAASVTVEARRCLCFVFLEFNSALALMALP